MFALNWIKCTKRVKTLFSISNKEDLTSLQNSKVTKDISKNIEKGASTYDLEYV